MSTGSGLFSIPEFINRNVLKLAPDAFVAINGNIGMRVITPANLSGTGSLRTNGGVTSINVTTTVFPPGSNKCTIEILAPVYKGLHEDYYTTLPNGTRKLILSPMMEVKVFMKGRFLIKGNPKYYPVFWGIVTEVSEDYSGGVFRFTVTCGDYLTWWKYQRITLSPATLRSAFGGPIPEYFPTTLLNMSPWQIIYNLCANTGFVDSNNKSYNLVYPDFSKAGFPPDFGKLSSTQIGEIFNVMAKDSMAYWNKRFGGDATSPQDPSERVPLEMYGLVGPIKMTTVLTSLFTYSPEIRNYQQSQLNAELDLNFNLLARIQPFGALDLYGDGGESLEYSKLEIATQVCEQTQMEFFVDTSGSLVFKPPFYNLDVFRGGLPYYVVDPSDIISFNSNVNSDSICTYLEAYAPRRYDVPALDNIGYHVDYDLLKEYGLRYQKVNLRYGNDARTLRLLAGAEMAKINGRATTGSASIPLRPEMRLGYPVYLSHIDAYYYVVGISHSVTIGSSASTTLSLEYRRDRIFSSKGGSYRKKVPDPEGGSFFVDEEVPAGGVLNGYVYRFREDILSNYVKNVEKAFPEETTEKSEEKAGQSATQGNQPSEQEMTKNEMIKKQALMESGIRSGPNVNGFYEITKAEASRVLVISTREDNKDAVVSNELLMITDETIPYTDINGYRHIGGFPYGANLILASDGVTFSDAFSPTENISRGVNALLDASTLDQPPANSMEGAENPPGQLDQTINISPLEKEKFPETIDVQFEQAKEALNQFMKKDSKIMPQADKALPVNTEAQTDGLLQAESSGESPNMPVWFGSGWGQ
jgi:hypothetical protein